MRFDSYHPAIIFLFFAGMLAGAVAFNQPVFVAISYLCPVAYAVVLRGRRTLWIQAALIPFVALFTGFYAYYNHFGVTAITATFIGNSITLESILYGCSLGIRVAAVLMWCVCIHAVISSDQVIYLFGRVAPKLSLLLAIALRMVPRIQSYGKKVHLAQKCIGKGMNQGSVFTRIRNFFRILSIVITWFLENLITTSDSMRSRGYALKGRSAFSIYRFDNRDRGLVILLFFCFTAILAGALLDQTAMQYNPEIILNRVTPASLFFYGAYAFVGCLPMLLQRTGEARFAKCIRKEFTP